MPKYKKVKLRNAKSKDPIKYKLEFKGTSKIRYSLLVRNFLGFEKDLEAGNNLENPPVGPVAFDIDVEPPGKHTISAVFKIDPMGKEGDKDSQVTFWLFQNENELVKLVYKGEEGPIIHQQKFILK